MMLAYSCGLDQNEPAPVAEDWFLTNARSLDVDGCDVPMDVNQVYVQPGMGNPDCSNTAGDYEYSAKFNVEDGEIVWETAFPVGFTVELSEDGKYLSWYFDGGDMCLDGLSVIVKGGPSAYVYMYDGNVICGTMLVSPTMDNGNTPEISNVSFCYNLVPCEVEVCYTEETAWAANGDEPRSLRYTNRGNWATYAAYAEKTVNLFSGQTYLAGTATFSAEVDGNITITIALADDHKLNEDSDEPVKVQDYLMAPSGNPSPGLFDYKDYTVDMDGNIVIELPLNNFYGIHLDVMREVPCEY